MSENSNLNAYSYAFDKQLFEKLDNLINQVDLYHLSHFDSNVKVTSLKQLEQTLLKESNLKNSSK